MVDTADATSYGQGRVRLSIPKELGNEGGEADVLFFVVVGGTLHKWAATEGAGESINDAGDKQVYDRSAGSQFIFSHSRSAGDKVGVNISYQVGDGAMVELLEKSLTSVSAPDLSSLSKDASSLTLREGGLVLDLPNNENAFNGFSDLTDVTLSLSVLGKAFSVVKHFSGDDVSGEDDSTSTLDIEFGANELAGMEYGDNMVFNIIAKNAVGLSDSKAIMDMPVRDVAEKVAPGASVFTSGNSSISVSYNAGDRTLITKKKVYSTLIKIYHAVEDTTQPADANNNYPLIAGNQIGSDIEILMGDLVGDDRTQLDLSHTVALPDTISLQSGHSYFCGIVRVIQNASGQSIEDGSTPSDAVLFKYKVLAADIQEVQNAQFGSYIDVNETGSGAYKPVEIKWNAMRALIDFCQSPEQDMPIQHLDIEIDSPALLDAGYFQVNDSSVVGGTVVGERYISLSSLFEKEIVQVIDPNGDGTQTMDQQQNKLGPNGHPYVRLLLTHVGEGGATDTNGDPIVTLPTLRHDLIKFTGADASTAADISSHRIALTQFPQASDSSLELVAKTDDLPSASGVRALTSVYVDTDPAVVRTALAGDDTPIDVFNALTIESRYEDNSDPPVELLIYGAVAGVTQFEIRNLNVNEDAFLSQVTGDDGVEHKRLKVTLAHENEAPTSIGMTVYKRIPASGSVEGGDYQAAYWSSGIVLGTQSQIANGDSNFYIATNVVKTPEVRTVIVDLAGKGINFGDSLMFETKTYLHGNALVKQNDTTFASDTGAGFGSLTTQAPGAATTDPNMTFGLYQLLPNIEPATGPTVSIGVAGDGASGLGEVPVTVTFDPSSQRDTALNLISPFFRLVAQVQLKKASTNEVLNTKEIFIDSAGANLNSDSKHEIAFEPVANNIGGFKAALTTFLVNDTNNANHATFQFFGQEVTGTAGDGSDILANKTRLAMVSAAAVSAVQSVASPPSIGQVSVNENSETFTLDFGNISANGSPLQTINGIIWGQDTSLSGVDNSWSRTVQFNINELTADDLRSDIATGTDEGLAANLLERQNLITSLASSNFSATSLSIRLPIETFDKQNQHLSLDGVLLFVNNQYFSCVAVSTDGNGNFISLP